MRDFIQDDYFPCDENGNFLFGHNRRSTEEYWVAIVEKAYAKMCGCYYALERGNESDGLVDFTNGVSFTMNLQNTQACISDLAVRLYNFQQGGYLIGCARECGTTCQGIIPGHAYQVIRVLPQLPLLTGERLDVVQVNSPWERGEWIGDWSRGSPVWDLVSPNVRITIGAQYQINDGSFFMLLSDFCAVFDRLYLCKGNLDGYRSQAVRGNWTRDKTSGGSADCSTWTLNPQYRLFIDRPVYAFIVLSQGDARRAYSPDGELLPIGFSLFSEAQSGKRVMFAEGIPPHGQLLERVCFSEMRERALSVQLVPEQSPYLIVPALYRADMESSFLLTVFAEESADFKLEPVCEWAYVKRFTGHWTSTMSGGCTNHSSWRSNPSFTIRNKAPPGVENQITFVLTTEAAQNDFQNAPSVGIYLLQGSEVVGHCKSFAQHVHYIAQFPVEDTSFAPLYNLLVATFNPGFLGKFMLTASSDYPFEMIPDDDFTE